MSINKVLLSGLLACSLSACSRDLFISHNGNMPTNERIEQVKVGQSKNQVKSMAAVGIIKVEANKADKDKQRE